MRALALRVTGNGGGALTAHHRGQILRQRRGHGKEGGRQHLQQGSLLLCKFEAREDAVRWKTQTSKRRAAHGSVIHRLLLPAIEVACGLDDADEMLHVALQSLVELIWEDDSERVAVVEPVQQSLRQNWQP